jgi:hypothetical protein
VIIRSVLFLLLLATSAVAQQQSTIPGRVLDKDGNPVKGVEVILHKITEQNGSEVDNDTSDADGSFQVEAKDLNENAVYFVGVIWQQQLYMGDLMRPPFPIDQEYVVRVGVNPVDLSGEPAAPQVTPQEAKKNRTAGTVVIIVAALIVAAIIYTLINRRPPARRRWLVELARLEDELASDPDESGVLKRRRMELRTRLKASSSS